MADFLTTSNDIFISEERVWTICKEIPGIINNWYLVVFVIASIIGQQYSNHYLHICASDSLWMCTKVVSNLEIQIIWLRVATVDQFLSLPGESLPLFRFHFCFLLLFGLSTFDFDSRIVSIYFWLQCLLSYCLLCSNERCWNYFLSHNLTKRQFILPVYLCDYMNLQTSLVWSSRLSLSLSRMSRFLHFTACLAFHSIGSLHL